MRKLFIGFFAIMVLLLAVYSWGAQGYLFLDNPVDCFVSADPAETQTVELPEFMTETVGGRIIKRWPNLQADALKVKQSGATAVWYVVTVGDYLEQARALPEFLADSYTGILYRAFNGEALYVTIAKQLFNVSYMITEDIEGVPTLVERHMNLGDWITAGKPGTFRGIRVPLRVFGIAAERGVEVE